MDIFVIAAEVCLVIISCFLLNWLSSYVFKQISGIPLLKKSKINYQSLQRNFQVILIIVCLLFCFLIIGVNAWLINRGESPQEYVRIFLGNIPLQFWLNLGIGLLKCILLLAFVALAINPLSSLINYSHQKVLTLEFVSINKASADLFFIALNKIFTVSMWLLAFVSCSQFLGIPESLSQYFAIAVTIYLIIAVGLLVIRGFNLVIDSLDDFCIQNSHPDNLLRFYQDLRHLIVFFKRCLEYIVYVSMATLVLQQIELVAYLAGYGAKVLRIIVIIFICRIIINIAQLATEEILLSNPNLSDEQRQRRLTIIPIINSSSKYLLYFASIIFVLDSIGIDPAPILAGAGIVGLAVGLGAQNLINDVVSGFFVLFENYYLVGDYIATDSVEGVVEAIELRTTRIRHPDGQLQIIRNGDVNSITNYSKEYVYAVVEIGIEYDSNIDHIYKVLEGVGQQLKEKEPDVLEATTVEGIEEFGDFDILIRTHTKVKPGKHIKIQRVVRKMIKDAFDLEGIEMNAQDQAFLVKQESNTNSVN